jgi:hypothetical protein
MPFWDSWNLGVKWLLLLLPRTITRVILGISVKSGKDSTSTLSFCHTQGGTKKQSPKKYISIQGGHQTLETIRIVPEFSPCLSFFLSSSIDIDSQCSYLYSHYSSSQNLCIKSLDSAFCTEFQHFILRFDQISLLYFYH